MAKIETMMDLLIGRYSEKRDQETAINDAIVYAELQINPSAYDDSINPDSGIGQERIRKFTFAEHEAFLGDRDNLSKLILEDGTTLVTKELPTERETQIGWALVNLASSIRRPR